METARIYLAGTVYKEPVHQNWKINFKNSFSNPNITFFDPCPQDEVYPYMVKRDKQEIDSCDIFVAYIKKPTFGTAMEVLYAHERGKPVIIIGTKENKMDLWLEYHSDINITDIETAVHHINNMIDLVGD